MLSGIQPRPSGASGRLVLSPGPRIKVSCLRGSTRHWATYNECTGAEFALCNIAHSHRLFTEALGSSPRAPPLGRNPTAAIHTRLREWVTAEVSRIVTQTGGPIASKRAEVGSCRSQMMSFGVPLGAKSPYQADQKTDGSPISAKVGMSGACATRLSLATAYALMFPARISGS